MYGYISYMGFLSMVDSQKTRLLIIQQHGLFSSWKSMMIVQNIYVDDDDMGQKTMIYHGLSMVNKYKIAFYFVFFLHS